MPRYLARAGWWVVLATIRKAADIYYGASCARYFALRRHEWGNAARSVRSMFDSVRPGRRFPRTYYRLSRRTHDARRMSPTRRALRWIFRAVADADKLVWIRPEDITQKVSGDLSLFCHDVLPGDWDLATRALGTELKLQAVAQRFQKGDRWRKTDLFSRKYVARLDSGAAVRGSEDLAALERHYEAQYDELHASIREYGFQVSVNQDGVVDVPHVHIGRDGRILFGSNGNHRLMMAKLLGVEWIPCRVRARHLEWQQVRDRVAVLGPMRCWEEVDSRLATHPDLADLLPGDGVEAEEANLDVTAARIPSLYGTRSALLLRRLASQTRAGTAVVHVGGWLGGGTAQLARGIAERPGGGEVRLHAYDAWRAEAADVECAARRGVSLATGEDLLPRVRSALLPFGVPVELARHEETGDGWTGRPISLYVDEASAAFDVRARGIERCAGSWIPAETVVVFMESRAGADGEAEEATLRERLLAAVPESLTLLEETERCKVLRYTAGADAGILAAAARAWSLAATLRTREREIHDLRRSTSWRVTVPLRCCTALARAAMPRRRMRAASGAPESDTP